VANVKPIIQIDVDDSAFSRFYSVFEQYTAQLEHQPETWRALGEAMGESGAKLEQGALTGKEALALAAAQATTIAEALKNATKAQDGFGAASKRSNKALSALKDAAQGVGKAISFVAGGILKLAAFGGLGALFGGFGIGELANAGFNRIREAGGLGISPGELASFQVNAQQFLTTSALEAAANAKIDITKAGALATLGIDQQRAAGMSTSELAFQTLQAAAQAYREDIKSGNAPMQDPRIFWAYINQLGGSIDEVRRAALQPAGVEAAKKATRRGIGALDFDQRTAQAWVRLKVALDSAGAKIQTAFINNLVGLAPKFERLTTDLTGFMLTFINSPLFGKLVDAATQGLKDLADFLEKQDIAGDLKKLEDFLTGINWQQIGSDITLMAAEIGAVAQKLSWLVPDFGDQGHAEQHAENSKQDNTWSIFPDNPFDVAGWNQTIEARMNRFGSDVYQKLYALPMKQVQRFFSDVKSGTATALQDAWNIIGDNQPIVAPAGAATLKGTYQPGAAAGIQQTGNLTKQQKADMIAAAQQFNIDPRLIYAEFGAESSFGKANPNADPFWQMGLISGPGKYGGYGYKGTGENTYAEAFKTNAAMWASDIKDMVAKGIKPTLENIVRYHEGIYTPVGAANDPTGLNSGKIRNVLGFVNSLSASDFSQRNLAKAVPAIKTKPFEKAMQHAPPAPLVGAKGQGSAIAYLGTVDSLIKTVDADIAKYHQSWIQHLPKDVQQVVRMADLPPSQTAHPETATIHKLLKAVLGRRTPKPAQVLVYNSTQARVAISVNALAAS
jgi:hypothetical protein